MANRKRNPKRNAKGRNKAKLRLDDRLRGFLKTIQAMGFSGDDIKSLPKRWGGFNRPGSMKK